MYLRGAGLGKCGDKLHHLPMCIKELNGSLLLTTGRDTGSALQSQRALTQSGTSKRVLNCSPLKVV